ncbi:MAG TPA: 3'-5' exonuclease [Candidatus Mcinerneyibacteriales bacterium]|nr:3'-5' exonuclease [Candidatus Mcinerneyibacteriales bacterium]HPE20293.1 3'-5' exonuclease [Candidatus Mcinerneyibacteriales bacterium]HPJ69371.1 3'-5' exonuclease [Candidatus Mcinerneyibacteriales bacterium]HPQ88950.1 3'-5' exonuclease [Candidatus Mcinerneyibacteriales bacterium]
MNSRLVIFFDFETNGFAGSSVLEAALIKCRVNAEGEAIPIHIFHRYYHAEESFNMRAFEIHGLSPDIIEENRMNQMAEYARYFVRDEDLFAFSFGCSHWVAHNIDFDTAFLPFQPEKQFCTMKENTSVLKLPRRSHGGYKYPTLKETALYYGLDYEESKAHSGLYDATLARDIFLGMLKAKNQRAHRFLAEI